MSTPTLPISALAGLCLAAFAVPADAAILAYYQHDSGTPGSNAGAVVPSETGNNSGSAGTVGSGAVPTYAAGVPGPIITSGLGGAVVNPSNTGSLSFVNPSANASGGKISIPATSTTTVYQPASFTMEAFINTTSTVGFTNIFSYNRTDAGGSSWMLDTTGTGQLRARFDTQAPGTSGTTAPGFNQNIGGGAVINDGVWHHVALSYDGATRQFTIYRDYVQVATGTATNPLVYDASSNITYGAGGGGQGFTGLMDEVRLSNTVLAPNDFLRAIPEPATALLGAIGLLGLLRRKRA